MISIHARVLLDSLFGTVAHYTAQGHVVIRWDCGATTTVNLATNRLEWL
jgi:hypothetical protein